MNKDIKRRWIARLRSGNYKQGYNLLRNRSSLHAKYDMYCCLGVLCDIAVEDAVIAPPVAHDNAYAYDGRPGSPSRAVLNWAGLSDMDVERCVTWNDNLQYNFKKIAAKIEENF